MGEPGHNSKNLEGLTDDQQRALLMIHLGDIEPLKEKLASINGELRQAYKKAKADGFSKKVIDYAFELLKNEEAESNQLHQEKMRVARWLGHPIGTQPDLFEFTPVDKAYEEGKQAGMRGADAVPPEKYGIQGDNYEKWQKGYFEGATARATAMEKQVSQTNIVANQAQDDGEEMNDLDPAETEEAEDEPSEEKPEDEAPAQASRRENVFTENVRRGDQVIKDAEKTLN